MGDTSDTYCQLFSALHANMVLFGIFFLYEDWNLYRVRVCVCVCVEATGVV